MQILVRSLLWLPIGLGLLIIFPPEISSLSGEYVAEREFTYVRGVAELLPAGAKGLMLSGILTAVASTKPFLGSGMGVVLVLRWVWWRINAWGELACIVMSTLLAPILLWAFPTKEALSLILMAIGATFVGIAVSFIAGPEEQSGLIAFYERARPPGFWGPIADKVDGTSSKAKYRLWRGLSSTMLSALFIFCILTAVGSYWVVSPPPDWFPWQSVWQHILWVVGVSLFPLWIFIGFFDSAKS